MATNVFDLYAKVGIDTTQYEKGMNMVEKGLGGLGNIASNVFSKFADLASTAGNYLLGFAKDAVQTGAEFEQAMAGVAATLGQTTEQVEELRNFAMEMGETTMFSAREAAQGLNYMALAGYDAEKAMEMLPKVLDLAAAGGMQLAYASDMFTDAVSALQLPADEADKLIDRMAKTASSSNTSISQLGEAILQIGGTAKDLKGGTLELTTLLGILADNGMKGAEGGTHLRNMLNSLISPTKDAKAFMEEYNVSLFDAEGNMRGLNEVFTDLNRILSQMSDKDRSQALTDLFNARDLKAANALLAGMTGRYEQLSSVIYDSEGAAAQMSKTMMDTLSGDVKLFKSALEGLKISFADGLNPVLREGVQIATEWIGNLSEFLKSDGVKDFVSKIANQADTLMTILKFKSPVKAFKTITKEVKWELQELSINWRKKYLPELRSAASELLPFIAETIAYGANNIIDGAKCIVPWIAHGIVETAYKVGDGISIVISEIGKFLTNEEALNDIFNYAATFIEDFFAGLEKNAAEMGSYVTGVVTKFGEQLTDAERFEELIGYAADFVKEFAEGLLSKESLDKLADEEHGIPKFVKNIGENIELFVRYLSETAGKIVEKFGDYLNEPENIQKIEKGAAEMIVSLGAALVKSVGHLYKFAVQVAEALIGMIVSAFKNLMETGGFVGQLISAVREEITGTSAEERLADIDRGSDSYDTTLDTFNKPNVPQAAIDAYRAQNRTFGKISVTAKTVDSVQSSGENININFGDINVSGDKNAGQEVAKQIDKALREMQIQQQRGIGGVIWQ